MTFLKDDGYVEFRFYRPNVAAVKLAGDFCRWSDSAINMASVGNGWWLASVHLNPGEYRFRYIADGKWFTDYASHGIENCNQGWNSVLLIPQNTKGKSAA